MQITINDHRKIHAVQREFNQMFPYLKIEFFAKPHKVGAPSSKKTIKDSSKTIGQCRVVHNKGSLTISPGMTVADLEQNFRDVYGLSAQVFRKSGKVWIETTKTDNWTLGYQNDLGMELSALGRIKHEQDQAAE